MEQVLIINKRPYKLQHRTQSEITRSVEFSTQSPFKFEAIRTHHDRTFGKCLEA